MIKTESFRDKIATAEKDGSRIWMYPSKPRGRLHRARSIVAVCLLLFFFIGPFLKFNGHPLLLFNIFERHFIFFGLIFKPQDFHLLVMAALTMVVFIVLFTAIFGRLFCGWVCPQTIFLEMVFRKIDYLIDGSQFQQKKLDKAPWGINKIFKRLFKHTIFLLISLLICNYFIAYIIGAEKAIDLISQSPMNHPTAFAATMIVSFLFYGVFAWFREQACTMVCPYGRLQSVLVDSNTIIVAYDYKRGEPRGKNKPGVEKVNRGDCIDCFVCVKVCPTGIDIRNGTQLECINCTACIDACNDIMKKTNRPQGLIKYSSESKLSGEAKSRFTGRIIVYSIVLTLLLTLSIGLLFNRTEVEAIILRASGSMYYESDNIIRNLYTAKITNKTFDNVSLDFRLKVPSDGKLSIAAGEINLKPEEITEAAFIIEIPRNLIYTTSLIVVIEILADGEVVDEVSTSFMAPERTDSDDK